MSDCDNHSLRSLNDDDRAYMLSNDDDNYSVVTDDLSEKSVEKKPVKRGRNNWLYDDVKSSDPGYHRIVKAHDGIKTKTEVYSTPFTPSTMIRDAITGYKHHEYRVGSWHEDLFFKVIETSGNVGKGLFCLYYDSPEQYERHMKGTVSDTVKRTWTEKFASAQARLEH